MNTDVQHLIRRDIATMKREYKSGKSKKILAGTGSKLDLQQTTKQLQTNSMSAAPLSRAFQGLIPLMAKEVERESTRDFIYVGVGTSFAVSG